MEPYKAYKIHVAIKEHFWSKYDMQKWPYAFKDKYKYGTAINIPYKVFESKQGLPGMFEMVCDKFKQPEFVALSVANAVDGDRRCGMPYGITAQQIFKEWIVRRDKISYTFGQDLEAIVNADQRLMSTDNDHPVEIRLLLGKHITIESVVILHQIQPFLDDYANDLIIGDTCLLIKRYAPFLKGIVNTKKLHLKHETLINKIASTNSLRGN